MKHLALIVLALGMAAPLFAQTQIPEYRFASGDWQFRGSTLYQNDANARLAKVNLKIPQRGAMIYEFSVRYEGGAENGHGGFGIHIFVDQPHNGESWGAGKSWLLWLNYDEAPYTPGIPRGFSAQVYRSITNSRMELVETISLNEYFPLLQANLDEPIPFVIEANGDTGEVKVYDPADPMNRAYFYFTIDSRYLPLRGDWIALRTNGIKLSFTMD